MSNKIKIVAFDADDTLWHNEQSFVDTQNRFRALLADHADPDIIEQRLYDTEIRNLAHYGYGVKSFTLSMVETAIDLTEGRIPAGAIDEILDMGREMLLAPVELVDGAREVVEELSRTRELMLVTMGDLLDQETKIARSGLGEFFTSVEIVSRKDRAIYESLLERYALVPREFAMIGNSERSDILPVAEMGGWAIHIPYDTTWAHHEVDPGRMQRIPYTRVDSIHAVPATLDGLEGQDKAGRLGAP